MGWSLYPVRFKQGEMAPIPLEELEPVLRAHGEIVSQDRGLELQTPHERQIASEIWLSGRGDVIEGVVAYRPQDTSHFRSFVFDLLNELGMTAIEPSGGPVLIGTAEVSDLPECYREHFQRIARAEDV